MSARDTPDAVRRALLRETIERAARVPWYRRRWGSRWKRVHAPEDLPALPFLTKDEAIAHQRELLAVKARPYVGTVSSGTQHGDKPLLRVLRVEEELRALAQHRQRSDGPSEVAPGRGGWVLDVRAMHHGFPEGPPPPGRLRVPWTYTPNAFRLVQQALEGPHPRGARPHGMIIGAGALMAVTAWLMERGLSPRDYGLREIGTYGFRLTPHWRQLVEEVWGAEVFDNFSLSEFATPALECRSCGYNHWLDPPLLFEVVDAFTRLPLRRGTGVLVLTGLHPFVQAMPLVRYWTGDLVELGPRCAVAKDRGIRFRGRLSQCVVHRAIPGSPVVLSPQDLEDDLEGRPQVARHPHPVEQLGLVKSPELGAVKYEVDASRPRAPLVTVELRFDPNVFPDAARAVGEGLVRHLTRASPALRLLERKRALELEVRVAAPGSVTRRWSKFG